jgi:ATP-binding cassette, subfamily B, bacterial
MYLDRRLWGFTHGVRLRIAWAAVVGLVAVGVGIVRLALLGWLLARVLGGAPAGALWPLLGLTIAATAVRAGLEYYRNMLAHGTAGRVQATLRRAIYDRVTALGPGYFTGARTGEVILSMVEGIQQLETYFGQYLPQLFVAALTPVLIFAFMAFLDLPVALVLLVTALLTLLAPALWHRWDSANSVARQKAYGAFAAEFLDAIQGLATLQAFGQSRARRRLLEDKGQELFRTTMWVLGTNTLARGITDTGIAVGAAAALGLGAWRVSGGQMELSALLVLLMLGIEVFRPLRELRVLLHQGMLGLSAAKGIVAILEAEPAVRDEGEIAGGRLTPTVAFENVSFAYPGGRRPAHEGLSFSVAAGERVAIVGPSGSGKSTIARLLLRLHDPQRGRVLVGGRDVRELSLHDLRRHIAVVHQDTYLFHGSVEDNLRMGRPDATEAELEAAARAANAHEFVAALPQGYRTIVGERGIRLSGGQRQRIAIARALLRDAPILVLDEALSAVDAENEAVIKEALDRLMQGRTTLIFAHRLSSVIGADRILVLESGRVVESGTHGALMARNGAYSRLMAGQAADGQPEVDLVEDLASSCDPAGALGLGSTLAEDDPADVDVVTRAPTPGVLAGQALGWPQVIRILLGMVRGFRARLALTFGLGVARVTALIGVGVLSALIVLAVKHQRPWGTLIIALLVVAPLAGILHWLESWLAHDLAFRLLADMRVALFRKLDALGPAYLTRRRSGDLVGVATHDIEFIEYFFAHTITPAAVAVLVPAAVLAVLAYHGWLLAAAVLPFLLYAGLAPVLARRRIDRLAARAREASGALNAHAADAVQGLAELVAFQHERAWGAAFEARAQEYVKARTPFLRDLTLQGVLQEAATGLGSLAVITAGAALASGGRLDAAVLPLLTLLAMSAFVPVWEIAQVGRQLADTLASTRRVYALHAEPVTVTDGPGVLSEGAAEAPSEPGRAGGAGARSVVEPRRVGGTAVEMREVTFTYPGRERPAVDGVSLAVPIGTTMALVGPSGAGKTTLANLLLRFWDPGRGMIRLLGHDLREHRLDELRARIALVAQDTYLFNATLRENILVARPEASEAALTAAVERAALAEFVASLPDGLDTVVGERGARLSGGQRQRVAIARAFLKDAPVLILDEATSHLDAVSEQAVRWALTELARERTTVVIAHRLSTIRQADQIVVLDGGRVVETGPHEALLERRGLYARLVSRQLSAAGG